MTTMRATRIVLGALLLVAAGLWLSPLLAEATAAEHEYCLQVKLEPNGTGPEWVTPEPCALPAARHRRYTRPGKARRHHHRKRRAHHEPLRRPYARALGQSSTPAPVRSSSPWLVPETTHAGEGAPPVHVRPEALLEPVAYPEDDWCDQLEAARVCRRVLLGQLTVRWSAPGEGEVVVSAPVCAGASGPCGPAEAWEGLTVYEYLWRSLTGPRLGLVADPSYLPRESAAEATCLEPSPAEAVKGALPHECPAGPSWATDVAASAPLLEALQSWTVFGQPLNGLGP